MVNPFDDGGPNSVRIEDQMPTNASALFDSVSASFQTLQASAVTLNTVSDELGKAIAQIDDGLKKLNLGVTVWVRISGDDDSEVGGSRFWSEDLGYSKYNGKWGVCIRKCDGDFNHMQDESIEVWPFSDAPRQTRLSAIDKVPELLQKLSEEAVKTASQIQAKLVDVTAVAEAINPSSPKRKIGAAEIFGRPSGGGPK
jgi:hypothetical protein